MPVIATAAWAIPKNVRERFPPDGPVLERYAAVFGGTEINSTFYRRHRPDTFMRWAATVPENFRFAAKMPKEITHVRRLEAIEQPFLAFLDDLSHLGGKLGPLLCQLPPGLAFDRATAQAAFAVMRSSHDGPIVLEPRSESWASPEAGALLAQFRIDRVLADPALVWSASSFEKPPAYIRLHGNPRPYYSSYSDEEIARFLDLLPPDGWCVFDNTASGAAAANALTMLELAGPGTSRAKTSPSAPATGSST